jgi:hypothetical protein
VARLTVPTVLATPCGSLLPHEALVPGEVGLALLAGRRAISACGADFPCVSGHPALSPMGCIYLSIFCFLAASVLDLD